MCCQLKAGDCRLDFGKQSGGGGGVVCSAHFALWVVSDDEGPSSAPIWARNHTDLLTKWIVSRPASQGGHFYREEQKGWREGKREAPSSCLLMSVLQTSARLAALPVLKSVNIAAGTGGRAVPAKEHPLWENLLLSGKKQTFHTAILEL